MTGKLPLINEQDHFTKVSGNLNSVSEYILPKHVCIAPCPGEELKKGHSEIKSDLLKVIQKTHCLAFGIQARYTCWEPSHPSFYSFSSFFSSIPSVFWHEHLWRCFSLPLYGRGSLIWVYGRNWRQLTLSWETVRYPYNDINRHSQLCHSVWDQDLACDGACLHFIICLWILTIIHHNHCNRLFKLKCCLTGKWSSRNVLQN